jgi:hypothetical protein
MIHTLGIEEVLHRHIMRITLDRLLSEDVLCWAHEFLAVLLLQSIHVMTDVGTVELGLEWHFLQLHAMDAGACDTQQRGGCDESLHGGEGDDTMMFKKSSRYNIMK